MKYTNEVTIDLPRDRVVELFHEPDNLKHWLKGLVSFTHRSGEPGEAGAMSDVVMKQGNRTIEMVETIESRVLPQEFITIYTTKGMWNRTENYLTETPDGSTTWQQVNEFKSDALMMRLMMFLMPGMFRKESQKHMDAFKAFAETGASVLG